MSVFLRRLFSSNLNISGALVARNSVNFRILAIAGKKTASDEVDFPLPPKRPQSAFFMWQKDYVEQQRHHDPDYKFSVVKLGEIWNDFTIQDKARWILEYKQAKEEYEQKNEQYMKSLTPGQIEALKEQRRQIREDKEKRRKKRKKKRDELELGKPKKPTNAFLLYLLSLDRGQISLQNFVSVAAASYRQLPEGEMKYFQDKSAQLWSQYKKDLREWELRMIRLGRSDLVRVNRQEEALKRSPKNTIDFSTD